MGHPIVRTLTVLLLSGALVSSLASPPVIGIATARGAFRIDNSPVRGNTTVFEGATVETSTVASLVRLQGGAEMQLGVASRARIYGDRLVLEKGEGQIQSALSYRIEAQSLRIVADSSGAVAHVAVREPGRIAVTALAGEVRVTTADGTLLARLERGSALEFNPQAAGTTSLLILTGCLAGVDGRYLLTDETAKISFELRGQDIAKYAGQRVEIVATGLKDAQPAEGTAGVILVTQIKRVAGGCPMASGTSTSGGNRPAGSAKASGKSGTTKAIIAGVAIAAAAGGTVLGLTGRESSPPISP